jgi:hypothetical protein
LSPRGKNELRYASFSKTEALLWVCLYWKLMNGCRQYSSLSMNWFHVQRSHKKNDLGFLKPNLRARYAAHTCNPSTQKAEAGWLQVQGQPGLHNKTLSQKKKKKTQKDR